MVEDRVGFIGKTLLQLGETMTSREEEELEIKEAVKLLDAVSKAYSKGSSFYEDIAAVEFVPYKNLAVIVISTEPGVSKLDIAQRSFALGAYLGIQYSKLKKMMESST